MALRSPFAVLLLIFVTLGIYYPTIFAGANSLDDLQMINAYINVDNIDLKSFFLPGSSAYYYRPILGLSFLIDRFAWGMNESIMHLENILFHTINTLLVYFIAVKAARTYSIDSVLLPFCAALLFALHPINTESVNWISGRTDLLVGIFLLFSILLLLHARQNENLPLTAAASVSFLFACFAKEVAVCALPGLLAIIVFHNQHELLLTSLRKKWVCASSLIATAVIYFLFRVSALSRGDTGMKAVTAAVNEPAFQFFDTLRVVLKVSGFYLKKLFIPWPLNFAIVKISDYYVVAGLLLVFLVIYMLYKRDMIAALLLSSVCVTAPALLIALARMAWTPLAERYLYVPSATFTIAMSLSVYKYLHLKKLIDNKIILFAVVLLLSLCAYTTVNRNIVWQNNLTLFEDTLKKSPDFYLAKNELAHALQQLGKEKESRDIILSIEAPEKSKRGKKLVDSNRATIMAAEGDLIGAKKLLLRNIEDSGVLFPRIAEHLITVDTTLLNKERDKLKRRALEEEIIDLLLKTREQTGNPFYYYRIAQTYLNFGNRKGAQHYFNEAYLRSPDNAYYKQAAKKLAETLK